MTKTLSPTIVLIWAIVYMLTVGNQKTDSVIRNSLEAYNQILIEEAQASASESQEQRVEALLSEQVLEDYTESLPDYMKEHAEANGLKHVELEFGKDLTFYFLSPYESPYNQPFVFYDVNRLADAVAEYETSYCTNINSPTANQKNNCWGIMTWKNGFRELKRYASIEDGKMDFIRIWTEGYGRLPTIKDAIKYSGKENYLVWWQQVMKNYYG